MVVTSDLHTFHHHEVWKDTARLIVLLSASTSSLSQGHSLGENPSFVRMGLSKGTII